MVTVDPQFWWSNPVTSRADKITKSAKEPNTSWSNPDILLVAKGNSIRSSLFSFDPYHDPTN